MHTIPPNIARASLRGATAATLLLAALVVVGCDKGRAPGAKREGAAPGSSPYADYLPKEPPVEKNRVVHPAGYSVASPPGWTMRIVSIESYMKDYVAEQFVLEGPQPDELKPVMTIQRLGPAGQRQWDAFAKPGAIICDRYVRTTFHGETAFSRFSPVPAKPKPCEARHCLSDWCSNRRASGSCSISGCETPTTGSPTTRSP